MKLGMAEMKSKNVELILIGVVFAILSSLITLGVANNSDGNDLGRATEPFFGIHQAGIETAQQAQVTLLTFDLKEGVDIEGLGRLLRVWTTDAEQATQGIESIGDPNPGMEMNPARLTATFGFGYSLFKSLGILDRWPISQSTIPSFASDALDSRWSDGDIVVQIAGDDPMAIFHLAHLLKRDAAPFALVRYQQRGFLNAAGVNSGAIGRNLLGQVDGTANPAVGTELFSKTAWIEEGPLTGGTTMVVRRIRFALENWDKLSVNNKSLATGRSITSGERVEAPESHVSLAKKAAQFKLIRRGFNYDDGYLDDGTRDAGLIFISFQREVESFNVIQRALAENDSLNIWAKHIGSSLFVIPGGPKEGEWIGQMLLQ
jgi:dye decolorizing peroxidase